MIELSYEQKQSLGFQFLLDSLSPNCVYGQEEVRKAGPYKKEDKQELEDELTRLKQLTEHVGACKGQLDKISLILMNLKEIRGSLKRGLDSVLNDIELFELKHFLIQSDKLKKAYGELTQSVEIPGIFFADTTGALDILDPENRRIPGFYIVDAYSEELRQIRARKKHLEVVLRQEHTDEKKTQLLNERKEFVLLEEEEMQRIREEITVKLRPHFTLLAENAAMAGRLDFLIQKAAAALTYGGIMPRLTENELELTEMTNPMIQEALKERGKEFTPVSFAMEQGTAVVTGANMGGKSVALRTIALNIVLAQSGFFVYAKQACVPVFDYMCLVAEEFQSIQNGLSSFGGEIMELQKSMEKLDQGFGFLLFDELARGTNPDEGAAIVQAVVKFLNGKNVMALIATHYDHVAEHAGCHYQVLGLKNVDIKQLEQEIKSSSAKKGIAVIAKYMDYGIYQVHGKEECPRDAIHICGLLGLESGIMDLIEL